MYRVLIVDDEAPARALLKMKVDWASINCEVIDEAKNGKEALEKYHTLKPDLIITDIQMPVMTGLEMITAIRDENRTQPIIILSCHESFSFARKAIKLGVHDYLIKDSFDTEELYSIIDDMFDHSSDKPQPSTAGIQSTNEQRRSIATQQLLYGVLSDEESHKLIHDQHLHLIGHQFILYYLDLEIIGLNPMGPKSAMLSDIDYELIQNLLRQSMNDSGEVCHFRENIFIVLMPVAPIHSQFESRKESIAIANRFRAALSHQYRMQTTIGISNPINHLALLGKAIEEGQHAAYRKIISGYNRTYVSTATAEDDPFIKILNVKLDRISTGLSTSDYSPISKNVKDIYLQNLKGFMQYNYLKHTNWTLLGMLIDHCSLKNISYSDIFLSRSPWEAIMDEKTVDGMCTWFLGAIERINISQVPPEEEKVYSYHVNNCLRYIQEHYDEKIGLSDLADKFDINNAYLSRIFKKETGVGLTDYINGIRVKEAQKLILETNKKMYEIAELTGFNNTQRFFSIFKKHVGQSPGDFRKQ